MTNRKKDNNSYESCPLTFSFLLLARIHYGYFDKASKNIRLYTHRYMFCARMQHKLYSCNRKGTYFASDKQSVVVPPPPKPPVEFRTYIDQDFKCGQQRHRATHSSSHSSLSPLKTNATTKTSQMKAANLTYICILRNVQISFAISNPHRFIFRTSVRFRFDVCDKLQIYRRVADMN